MSELEIQGIKNLEIIEVDFIPYFLLLGIILILFSLGGYFLFKKKKKTALRRYLHELFTKNLTDKEIAYAFTKYGTKILKKENKEKFDGIVTQLEEYKYKNKVPPINPHLKNEMIAYIKSYV